MKKTLQTIQTLLDDIKADVKLLRLTPLEKKVERVSQLIEGAIGLNTEKSTDEREKIYEEIFESAEALSVKMVNAEVEGANFSVVDSEWQRLTDAIDRRYLKGYATK